MLAGLEVQLLHALLRQERCVLHTRTTYLRKTWRSSSPPMLATRSIWCDLECNDLGKGSGVSIISRSM